MKKGGDDFLPSIKTKLSQNMFKKYFILPVLICFGMIQISFGASLDSIEGGAFLLAQNFEADDNELLDEEDSSDSDDLFSEDEEDDEDEDAENEDEFENQITFSDEYFLFAGRAYSDNADLTSGNSVDSESILENIYQFTGKLQTSEYSYYYLRMTANLRLTMNYETDQYKEEYKVKIREGYYYQQEGVHRFQVGAKILNHGKVDYKSPINVLSMGDQDAIDILNLNEDRTPTLVLMYDWLGKGQSTSFLLAPFKQKTEGTEFTILKEETENDEAGEDPDDSTVLRAHAGLKYQVDLGNLSTRWSVFRWFDRDNKISWKEQRSTTSVEDVDTDQDYKEDDTTITFLTGELDWTLGSYVWKTDVGYFFKKNFVHYERTDAETDAYTVQLRHLAVATSLERKFDKLFLMPTYTYYKIWDVDENEHIMMYENEETPKTEAHDLYKHQVALIAGYEFSDNMNASLSYATTTPFDMNEANFSLTWNPDGGSHEISLKMFVSESEKIKMTDKKIKKQLTFLNYSYKM